MYTLLCSSKDVCKVSARFSIPYSGSVPTLNQALGILVTLIRFGLLSRVIPFLADTLSYIFLIVSIRWIERTYLVMRKWGLYSKDKSFFFKIVNSYWYLNNVTIVLCIKVLIYQNGSTPTHIYGDCSCYFIGKLI